MAAGVRSAQRTFVARALLVTLFVGALIADVAALAFVVGGSWGAKAGVVLSIVGFYGIALGFLGQSEALERFGTLKDDMVSSNLARFVAGNLHLLGIVSLLLSVGLSPWRAGSGSAIAAAIAALLLVAAIPVFLAYAAFHLLVVVPFAYLAYFVASGVVDRFQSSSSDFEVSVVSASGEVDDRLRLRALIGERPGAAKSFIIGLPAAMLALFTQVLGLVAR